MSYGETDEFCYDAASDSPKVGINDLNATILHQLGIDHQKPTFKHQGLDFRLTGVEPCRVLKDVLA